MEAYSTPKPPLQGKKIDTLENARDHYTIYACKTGFAIRQQFKKEMVDGTISRVFLVCTKYCKRRRDRDELQDVENPTNIVKKREKIKLLGLNVKRTCTYPTMMHGGLFAVSRTTTITP